MFITILIMIFLFPIVLLPMVLNTFSHNDLDEMGVCLETSEDLPNSAQSFKGEHCNTNLHLLQPTAACR